MFTLWEEDMSCLLFVKIVGKWWLPSLLKIELISDSPPHHSTKMDQQLF